MTQREEFKAWWEEFCSAHEDWRFADSDALRWAAWQAAQAVQPAQPEGWKLVPVEPTQAMVEAAGLDCVMGKSAWDVTTALWSAMLSAAPSTKENV